MILYDISIRGYTRAVFLSKMFKYLVVKRVVAIIFNMLLVNKNSVPVLLVRVPCRQMGKAFAVGAGSI